MLNRIALAGAAAAFLVATGIINVWTVQAQTRSAPKPKFEAASIKRCTEPSVAEGEGRGGGEPASSDRLRIACWSLAPLIRTAYVVFAGGRFNGNNYPVDIVQLPAWGNSELYMIEAKAEGSPGQDMMHGPMLQALVESRFALKIHAEMKDEPAYALTVAKGGLKLRPFQGGCTPLDPIHPPSSPVQDPCPRNLQDSPMSLDIFAWFVGNIRPRIFDEPVINETGITGYFHFNVEPLIKLSATPGGAAEHDPAESIFTAVQDFGLKLQAVKAPRQYLVVEHVERPSAN
jgi:uncharacterized protein (TIGR03435 family)